MDAIFSLTGANIVILAKNHNPSIISKEWLTQKEIIKEAVVNFVHTPPFSLIETDNFKLIVDSARLQLSVKTVNPKNIDTLPKITGSYVIQLPETPYTAIGFNYSYRIGAEKSPSEIFSVDTKKFKKIFSDGFRLGGTIHFKFQDFAVRINLQPSNKEFLADFNFHLEPVNLEKMKINLDAYSTLRKKAEEILEELFHV